MEVMEKLEYMTKDPGQYAAEWTHQNQRPAIGVFPNYFPVEILDAGGILPVGLWGSSLPISQADSHLPPYVCSLVKSNFEMALQGRLKSLSGAVFSEICDTVQNAESVWKAINPDAFTTRYRLSKNPTSQGAKPYLVAELKRIAQEVKDHFKVEFSELDLIEAIMRRNGLRARVRELMTKFFSGKSMMHPMDFYLLVHNSHIVDSDEWMKISSEFISGPSGMSFGGTKVLLSGMTPEPLWILDELDRVNISIVGDDIAYSWRYYQKDVATEGDPYENLADYTLSLSPCANLHYGINDRADYLVKRVKETGADGVVFTRLKFCDPEAFDHPMLKKRLDAEGIPSLLLETELSATDVGAIATRIEAFAEQLEQGEEG